MPEPRDFEGCWGNFAYWHLSDLVCIGECLLSDLISKLLEQPIDQSDCHHQVIVIHAWFAGIFKNNFGKMPQRWQLNQ